MPTTNKQNITGIKFPGNDTIFVLQAETTDIFSQENELVATNVKGVNKAIENIEQKITANNNTQDKKIKDLESKISGAMHFIGVKPSIPEETSAYKPGDVILVKNKEYVFNENSQFVELGDTTQEAKDISDLKKSMEVIQGEASVSGSIQEALADSKKYTDDKVSKNTAAIETINNPDTGILTQAKNFTTEQINNLNVETITASQGQIIGTVSQSNGKISATTKELTEKDIPALTPAKSGINNSIIIKEISEPIVFEDTQNGTDYPFKGIIPVEGCTTNYYPSVSLKLEDAISGIFAPIVESYDGGVYIYASEQPEKPLSNGTVALYKAF